IDDDDAVLGWQPSSDTEEEQESVKREPRKVRGRARGYGHAMVLHGSRFTFHALRVSLFTLLVWDFTAPAAVVDAQPPHAPIQVGPVGLEDARRLRHVPLRLSQRGRNESVLELIQGIIQRSA